MLRRRGRRARQLIGALFFLFGIVPQLAGCDGLPNPLSNEGEDAKPNSDASVPPALTPTPECPAVSYADTADDAATQLGNFSSCLGVQVEALTCDQRTRWYNVDEVQELDTSWIVGHDFASCRMLVASRNGMVEANYNILGPDQEIPPTEYPFGLAGMTAEVSEACRQSDSIFVEGQSAADVESFLTDWMLCGGHELADFVLYCWGPVTEDVPGIPPESMIPCRIDSHLHQETIRTFRLIR